MSQLASWRYLTVISTIAILYFLAAKLSLSLLHLGLQASPLWIPAGVALAALLWCGRCAWLGVALGIGGLNLSLHTPLLLSAGSVLGNTLEAVVAVTLLERLGFRASLERLRDVLAIVLTVLVAPLVGATIGNLTAYLTGYVGWSRMLQNGWTVWLGDGMGMLVFTPWLLSLRFHRPPYLERSSVQPWERLLWLLLLGGVSWAVFYSRTQQAIAFYPLEYFPFPFIIWAALRFGQRSAICGSFLLSVIAISGTVQGYGPFSAKVQPSQQTMLSLQAFIGVITITALILAAVTAERQRAESLLRRSSTSLANAQYLARLGNWDFDFSQQRWNWSAELYRLLGLSPCIMPNQEAFLQAVHPADRERVRQAMIHALDDRKSQQLDYRILLPDGAERIVEEQVTVGEAKITGTVQDVTERKQAEEELRLTAEQNRLLAETALRIRQSLDLAEVLTTTVNEIQQLLKADRVFICQFNHEGWGRMVAEAVVSGWASISEWQTSASAYHEIQALFTQDQTRVVHDTATIEKTPFIQDYYDRYQVKASIGIPLVLNARSLPCFRMGHAPAVGLYSAKPLDSPEPQLFFGVLVVNQCAAARLWQPAEIELLEQLGTQVAIALQQAQLYQQVQALNSTLEQQVTERTLQLEASLAKLEEVNKLREVLMHAIAHDLRTTVIGSQMVLKTLLTQSADSTLTVSRSLLERMTQSGDVQLSKLNALLEAYLCQTQGIVLHRVPVSLTALIEEAIADTLPLFAQNQARLIQAPTASLPLVVADAQQLGRVVQQLLTNAVKHNPPGVTVSVQVEMQPGQVRCVVADNGRGISPVWRDRLFELRLGGDTDRQLTGISLGLYLCRQIIRAHGGDIGVSSPADDRGLTVWFTLPIEKSACTAG